MTDSYLYLLIKAVLTLGFILAILGASLYALKHFMKGGGMKAGKRGGAAPVKVISNSFLGQKKNLAIVDIAGEILVLGITPTSITCLAKVEKPEAIDELKKLDGVRMRPFLNLFQ